MLSRCKLVKVKPGLNGDVVFEGSLCRVAPLGDAAVFMNENVLHRPRVEEPAGGYVTGFH